MLKPTLGSESAPNTGYCSRSGSMCIRWGLHQPPPVSSPASHLSARPQAGPALLLAPQASLASVSPPWHPQTSVSAFRPILPLFVGHMQINTYPSFKVTQGHHSSQQPHSPLLPAKRFSYHISKHFIVFRCFRVCLPSLVFAFLRTGTVFYLCSVPNYSARCRPGTDGYFLSNCMSLSVSQFLSVILSPSCTLDSRQWAQRKFSIEVTWK